jgi:hypothetical protein
MTILPRNNRLSSISYFQTMTKTPQWITDSYKSKNNLYDKK